MSQHSIEVYVSSFDYLVTLLAHLYYPSTRVIIKAEMWAEVVCHFEERCKEE